MEQKASQSLPALQAPVLEPDLAVALEASAQRIIRRACTTGLASVPTLGAPEARHGLRASSRHPMPHRCSRHPFEHAFHAPRGCVCLPEAPRAPKLMNSTPPWTFGQGRTHASGWRYESRTDPPVACRARPCRRRRSHALEARRCHQPRSRRNAQAGRITRFIFTKDRAGQRVRAGRQYPWVGAATFAVASCVSSLDHASARATESA